MAHRSAVEKSISTILVSFLKRVLSMQIENWQRPRDHNLKSSQFCKGLWVGYFNSLIDFVAPCNIY